MNSRKRQVTILRCDADAEVVHRKSHPIVAIAGSEFDHIELDVAGLGEFRGIAHQVENLSEPGRVGVDGPERVGSDQAEPFRPRAGRGDVRDDVDDVGELEFAMLELDQTELELREIEDVVDQLEECVTALADGRDLRPLVGSQFRSVEQIDHADNAVERRANLVAHRRQKE